MRIAQPIEFILDLIFPITCIICDADGEFICPKCAPKLARMDKQICLKCQSPAPFGKTHPDCRTRNMVDGSISALRYIDPKVKQLIKIYKYDYVKNLSPILSALLRERIEILGLGDYFRGFILLPVPLHKKRQRWRGFNQADLFGRMLAQDLRIAFDDQFVARRRKTIPQVDLSADERKTNLEGAFSILKDAAGRKFLLADDVITTGSTMNEIAKTLKRAGAAEVWAISLAHG